MADLIDRDGLLKELTGFWDFLLQREHRSPNSDVETMMQTMEIVISAVKIRPTVTQTNAELNTDSALTERKEGRWLNHLGLPLNDFCSVCAKDSPYNKHWDYCPNCGAKMKKTEA